MASKYARSNRLSRCCPARALRPALYRMEEQGLIEAEWRPTENNRNAKFYALTRKGRRAAQAELDGWLRLSGAIARVLRALEQEA